MSELFSLVYRYFFILVVYCIWESVEGGQTSIHGIVVSEKNVLTRSLQNNNLVLIIKNDANHDDVHHLKLTVNEISFPIRFNLANLKEITTSGSHLMTLLIFGYTHRLLWEGVLFRQHLAVNAVNSITFIVSDVSNLPVCLSQGYPCIDRSDDIDDELISMCCSNTHCQLSNMGQLTCGGLSPIIENVTISYMLPLGMIPVIGLLDKHFVEVTEKVYQSLSQPGTIVKVINATIDVRSNNKDESYQWIGDVKFILTLHVSIITSEQCPVCRVNTLRSIETTSTPFNIPQPDGTSTVVDMHDPSVDITITTASTTSRTTSIATSSSSTWSTTSSSTTSLTISSSTTSSITTSNTTSIATSSSSTSSTISSSTTSSTISSSTTSSTISSSTTSSTISSSTTSSATSSSTTSSTTTSSTTSIATSSSSTSSTISSSTTSSTTSSATSSTTSSATSSNTSSSSTTSSTISSSTTSSTTTSSSTTSSTNSSATTTATANMPCGTTCVNTTISTSSRMAFYPFDDDTTDIENNYPLASGGSPIYVPGWVGSAINFSNSSAQILNTSVIALNTSSFTIDFWFYAISTNGSADSSFAGEKYQSSPGKCLFLDIRGSHLVFGFYFNDTYGNTIISDNRWYHAAFVYDNDINEQRIYLNGILDGNSGGKFFQSPGPFTIGGAYIGGAGPPVQASSGYIDHFTISSRRKSDCEVYLDAVLACYFKFDSNLSLDDSGPNFLTATNISAASAVGRVNEGLEFFSALSYITINGITALTSNNGTFTISMWINPTNVTGGTLIHASTQSDGRGICLAMWGLTANGTLSVNVIDASNNTISATSSSALSLNTWTHVAQIFTSKNENSLYINGTLVATVSAPTGRSIGPYATLGTSPADTNDCANGAIVMGQFYGIIDEYRVFGCELNATDICRLSQP